MATVQARVRLLAADGGRESSIERHRSRGKLFVRDRIDQLVDEDSPFLELGALPGWDLYEGQAPSAGIVTGIGRVEDRLVMVVANDATVKGGGVSRRAKLYVLREREGKKTRLTRNLGPKKWPRSGAGSGLKTAESTADSAE